MKPGRKLPEQLFVLGEETIAAMNIEDVEASYADMDELGIARLPVPDFDLQLPAKQVITLFPEREVDVNDPVLFALQQLKLAEQQASLNSDTCCIQVRNSTISDVRLINYERMKWVLLLHPSVPILHHDVARMGSDMVKCLVVLLGTRNAKRTTVESKLVKLGIGKSAKRYRYTTTIEVGELERRESDGQGTHASPRPHLRRGHKRNQRSGPNRQFVNAIWIEPMFVNGTDAEVSGRVCYSVKLAQSQLTKED